MLYLFSAIFLVAFVNMLREFFQWRDRAVSAILTHGQKTRRVFMSALILIVSGMGIRGSFFPAIDRMTHLQKAESLLYWGVCLLFLVAMLVVSYIEAKATYILAYKKERELVIDKLGQGFVFSAGDQDNSDDK